MVTEDYVSFETAKLMHDKGFNLAEFHGRWAIDYDNVPDTEEEDPEGKIIVAEWQYPLITIQMAMKWLRKKYNIHVEPRYFPTPNIYRYVIIRSKATFENIDSHPQYFNTNEEACEAGIRYVLENLI